MQNNNNKGPLFRYISIHYIKDLGNDTEKAIELENLRTLELKKIVPPQKKVILKFYKAKGTLKYFSNLLYQTEFQTIALNNRITSLKMTPGLIRHKFAEKLRPRTSDK